VIGPSDAKARRLVRLPDGRTGRLVYAPRPQGSGYEGMGKARGGRQAKVLVDGRHVRGPVELLTLVDDGPAE
jgi:hypothetical protein